MNRELRRMTEREQRVVKTKESGVAARAASARKRAARRERGPIWKRIVTFIDEVRVELRKVSWPTMEQLKAFTAVTLITSVVLTIYVFALDFGFKAAIINLLGGVNG